MIEAARTTWRRWRAPLSISVLDQGAVAGANFLLNVLLARWLSPSNYGAFAVAFAFLLLISGPHSALFTDPLNVVGPRRFLGRYREYLRGVLALHGAVTVPVGIFIAAGAVGLRSTLSLDATWLVALGLAIPLVPCLWLLRGACYLEIRPRTALAGSALYVVVLIGLVAIGNLGSPLTAPAGLMLMAVASAAASLQVATTLGLLTPPWTSVGLATIVDEHWRYGRWILGASVAHGVAYGLYIPLVGTLDGLEQTAVLRALQNLILPLQHLLIGIAMMAYPSMSHQVAQHGPGYLKRRGPIFVLLGVALAMLYGLFVTIVGRPLLSALYGRGYYAEYASLLSLLAAGAVMGAASQFLSILVRVLNQPRAVLWSKLAAAAWLAIGGIALVRAGGVRGAAVGLIGGSVAEGLVLTVALARTRAFRS